MSELVTGEAVALDLRAASLPSRVVATGTDAALQLAVVAAAGTAFAVSSVDVSGALAAALGIVLLVLVLAVYPIAFETLLRGRTPGKAVMGLRVVRDDGGPIGFRQALVRGLAGAFVEKPGITVFCLPIVLILVHPAGKRLGDLLAGTVVVQERVPARGGEVAQMPPPLAAWAATLELSRMPDALALSVRQFVARSGDMTPAAREDLGSRLVAAVREVTAPPPPTGTPGWAYLSAVLAERRRRETARLTPGLGGQPPPPAPLPTAPTLPAPPPAAPPQPAPAAEPSRGGFTAPS